MNVDTSSDENLLETNDAPTAEDLAREFTRPGFTFKGHELRPITTGSNQLFSQVLDRNDANTTAILSFLFIHRQSNWNLNKTSGKWEPTATLLEICWDKTKFRIALFDWIDGMGEINHEETGALFEEMNKSSKIGIVEPLPDANQKKTKAKRRPK